MKKIAKIVLPLMLVTLLGSCGIGAYKYPHHERYLTASDFSIDTKITDIEVNWVNGDVNILQGTTTSTYVTEEGYQNLPLYYLIEGTTLKIEFVKHGTGNLKYGNLDKDLNITLPMNVNEQVGNDIEIDINTVNSNVNFTSATCKDIDIELVNGDVKFDNISANEINIEMVNGNVTVNSMSANELSLDKVNGDTYINGLIKPIHIEISSVNGNDTIYVPETLGYKVSFDSIGAFRSDYGDAKRYGDEKVSIDYEAVNGDLKIKK